MESSKLEVDFCGRAKLEILRLAGGPWALACQGMRRACRTDRQPPTPKPRSGAVVPMLRANGVRND
jgi:hypothetical protein